MPVRSGWLTPCVQHFRCLTTEHDSPAGLGRYHSRLSAAAFLEMLRGIWSVMEHDVLGRWCDMLTHWGQDKIAAISQTFSHAFSPMKPSLASNTFCIVAQNGNHLQKRYFDVFSGWETKIFWHSPEPGSLLYCLYKIPLAQACFPLAQPNFHSHWRAGER